MNTEHNEAVSRILDHLAAAYAGHSQYPLAHVGIALHGHRNNGGLALVPVAELAATAAGLLARRWEWDQEQEATGAAEIRRAMRQAEAKQAEHDTREKRRWLRRPDRFEAVDQVMETCRQVIRNCEMATGFSMDDLPALAGRALASALSDGIVATRRSGEDYECTPEEAADFASGYLWPDRFDAGFDEEAAVIYWIRQCAKACEANLN